MRRFDSGTETGLQRPRPLAETAYEAIEQMIVSRRLPPGAMVSEGEIGAELALGRTPVREALARLKAIGFVEVHSRRGILVTHVDIVKNLELLEVRQPLEETSARCAIDRATQGDLDGLVACAAKLHEAAAARDRERYFRRKRALHEAAARAAYNSVLTAAMAPLHAQSRRFWYTYEPTSSFVDCAQIHVAIVAGIAARNEAQAIADIGRLFALLDVLTRRALDRRPLG